MSTSILPIVKHPWVKLFFQINAHQQRYQLYSPTCHTWWRFPVVHTPKLSTHPHLETASRPKLLLGWRSNLLFFPEANTIYLIKMVVRYLVLMSPWLVASFPIGCFFYCSALKLTKCKPDREISELFLPKKQLRMKKIKVPELFPSPKWPRKKFK